METGWKKMNNRLFKILDRMLRILNWNSEAFASAQNVPWTFRRFWIAKFLHEEMGFLIMDASNLFEDSKDQTILHRWYRDYKKFMDEIPEQQTAYQIIKSQILIDLFKNGINDSSPTCSNLFSPIDLSCNSMDTLNT